MYRFVRHVEIDFGKWDECIDDSQNGTIYSLSWYLNVVSPGWDAIINEQGGKYMAVFPVTHFKKFKVLKFIRQPHFANQLGLVHRNKILFQELLEVIGLLKKRYSYITSFPLNTANSEFINQSSTEKFGKDLTIVLNPSYQIDLSVDYLKLFGNFTSDRKNNIKRSMRNNLTLIRSGDIESLVEIFRENTAPRIYGGVRPFQYDLLRKLYIESNNRGMSEIYSVMDSSTTISGCLFFYYKKSIIKFFNASTPEGRKLNGDSFLMNELLKRWAGQHKIFDFEIASLKGINDYKESYGSSLVFYPSISYNNLPGVITAIKKIRYNLLSGKDFHNKI